MVCKKIFILIHQLLTENLLSPSSPTSPLCRTSLWKICKFYSTEVRDREGISGGERWRQVGAPMWCMFRTVPRFLHPITTASPLPNSSFPTFSRCGVSTAVYPSIASPEKQQCSSNLVEREYADLGLSNKSCQEVGHINIRPHVNPLKSCFMVPVELPDWNAIYKDAKLPLMVDIGSGNGRFLLWHAKGNCGMRNYLGVEIRPKLVQRAEYWAKELGLNNIHFIYANATVNFKQYISTYPGPLVFVSILCPDPYFKNKHHKRRVVQKPLVDSIIEGLAYGGQIFIQSDVQEVAVDMRRYFDAESDKLVHIDYVCPDMLCDSEGRLLSNPMGIRTEREVHAEFEGATMYRRMY